MKKFKFNLESFLTYRTFLEKKAKEDVVSALSSIMRCKKTIEDFTLDHKRMFGLLDEETDVGISMEKFRIYNEYIDDLILEIKNANVQLVKFQEELFQKQKILKQRVIEKKILENVKELKKEEYDTEMMALLQKESDDMISLKKAREIIGGYE